MPHHSSKNYYEAEFEVAQEQIVKETAAYEYDMRDYCFGYSKYPLGCTCSDCNEVRWRKTTTELVKKNFTPQQILDAFLQHQSSSECNSYHELYVKDIEKNVKKEYYAHILNKSSDTKVFETKQYHDIPDCVLRLLEEQYQENLKEEHRKRNYEKKQRERKRKGIESEEDI
jgi:hypothetical protein